MDMVQKQKLNRRSGRLSLRQKNVIKFGQM